MEKFFSICLQGDIKLAMEYLQSISPRTKEIEKIERLYKNRFYSESGEMDEEIVVEDPWIRKVILAYYTYFRAVLTKTVMVSDAESKLQKELAGCLKGKQPANIVETEKELKKIFSDKGYFFLGGVTKPYRGPYIWRNMESRKFFVETPLAHQWLTVNMMSDFLLESWIGYATFGNRHAGGWVKRDGLYCNSKLFKDFNGDDFQISFLKHEAQHYYDYEQFPWLTSKELEYRAKLVELIYYQDHSVLVKFLSQAKNDPNFPHPFASYRLIKNLSFLFFTKEYESDLKAWLAVDYKKITLAAHDLLEKDTKELQAIKLSKKRT